MGVTHGHSDLSSPSAESQVGTRTLAARCYLPQQVRKRIRSPNMFASSINVEEDVPREFLIFFGNTLYKGTMAKATWTGPCKSEEPVHALKILLDALPNVCIRAGV